MTAWYNECDPFAAQWLRNLIAAGHIAPGVVDERKIQDVEAWELLEFTQCHFFAGIGIWSGALRAAGWPDDRPIWTGSCPCQPFSNAGKRKGTDDERHLWPTWFGLIEQCKPLVVVGEQVSGGIAVGKWQGNEVQSLWERKATLGILQDGIEGEIKASLQDLSKLGSARLVQGTPTQHSCPSQPLGGISEGTFSGEVVAVRSHTGMVANQIGRQGLRSDGYPVQFQREAELEHSFTGSQNPRERIHTSEYESGPVRLEHWLRQLGRTEIDRNRLKSLEQAARKIRNAAKRIDRKIESESQSWIAALQADMEGAGYAIGASDLCAAGFGQAHLRQRLYFVGLADALHTGRTERRTVAGLGQVAGIGDIGGLADAYSRECYRVTGGQGCEPDRETSGWIEGDGSVAADCATSGLADSYVQPGEWNSGEIFATQAGQYGPRQSVDGCDDLGYQHGSTTGRLADATGGNTSTERQQHGRQHGLQPVCSSGSEFGGLADAQVPECEQPRNSRSRGTRFADSSGVNARTVLHSRETGSLDDADWLLCRNPSGEPSWRPVESGTFPLHHGYPDRMGKLRAYGNALDFKTAQGFCETVAEIVGIRPVTEYDL